MIGGYEVLQNKEGNISNQVIIYISNSDYFF